MSSIKDIYYYFEEKYYKLLDRIPFVYPVIDKIDAVIPSFIVVLAILALLILLVVGFFLAPFILSAQVNVDFAVKDSLTKNPIANARIDLNVNGKAVDSFRTDPTGYSAKIPLRTGDVITYMVTSNGYLGKTVRDIRISENSTTQVVLLNSDQPDFRDITVNFAVKGTNQPLKVPISVEFSCSPTQTNVPPAQTIAANTSSTTVNVPSGCSKLLVKAQARGYLDVTSYEVFAPSTTVYFEERDDFKGTLSVSVTFDGKPVKGIDVKVFEQSLGPVDEQLTDDQGNVSFKLSPSGTYSVATTPTENYGQARRDDIEVLPADTTSIALELRSDVSATMLLHIREGSKKVSGAKVSLRLGDNRIDSKTTDDNGDISFFINQLGSYTVTVDQADYLVLEKVIPITQSGNVEQTLQLTKYTGQGTTITVKVLDAETQKGVKRARVALYRVGTIDNPVEETTCNSGGSELVSAQGDLLDLDQYTDINGLARFGRMSRGCYAAVAIRGGSFGKSDPHYFRETDTNSTTLNVALEIPRGAIRVNVTDESGQAVSFARVELFDDFDNSRLGADLTNNDGTYELPATNANTKADKDVYVRVSAPEFSAYTSEARPIIGNGIQTFDVILRKPLLQDNLKILFEGLKSIDSNRVVKAGTNTIASGQTYHATWLVFVPEGQTYQNVVVHARTGKFELAYGELETDQSNFESVNMPLASIIKGTAIDPNNGEEADYQKVTADKFKWFNANFPRLGPGVYQLGADLKVSNTTILGDRVMLRWRTSGELEDEEVRYPADATSPAGSLYANTDNQPYQVGTVTLCDADFCFDASIYDEVEKLVSSVTDSYDAKTGQGYRLSFSVSNNSTYKTYPDSSDPSRKNRFVIENPEESLELTNYQVNSTQTFSNATFNGTKIDLGIGDMGGGERGSLRSNVTGNFNFLAKNPGTHSINFTFISKAQIAFQKTITINAISNKTMDVNVSPTLLPAALENRLTIKVKDAATGIEIENAIIIAKDRFDNTIGTAKTDRLGFAEMFLQGLEAGDTINVIVSAADYAQQVVPVRVSDQVIEVNPTDIGLKLNINAQFTDSKEITLKNWSQFPVTVQSLEYVGNSEGLLDEAQIQNNLIQYFGLIIPAGESRKITFSTYLSEEGKLITDLKQLTGELQIKAVNYGQTWTSSVNVKTSIGLGQLLDNENCLVVSPREWTNTSQGAPISQEFVVQNNCSVNGNPVAIHDLEAQVKWNSNPIGTFNVALVGGDSTGAVGSAEIREGYFKKLIGTVPAEKTYTMKITFTPRGGVNGLADAIITLQSHNLTDGKSDQVLTQDIQAKISTINVLECLTISKDLLSITKVPNVPQATTDFTIQNKTGCGEIEVTVSNYCRTENLSCDYLDVSPREFKLADGATSPAIQLVAGDATYPGQYAIKVSAKAKSQKLTQDITTILERDKFIRVRVFDPEQCFLLSKYEFEVWDDPTTQAENEGQDRAVLTNNCPNKQLTVKIDTAQFFDAAKKSGLQQMLDILGYAAGTGMNYMFNNGLLGGIIGEAVTPTIQVIGDVRQSHQKINNDVTNSTEELNKAIESTNTAKEGLDKIKGTQAAAEEEPVATPAAETPATSGAGNGVTGTNNSPGGTLITTPLNENIAYFAGPSATPTTADACANPDPGTLAFCTQLNTFKTDCVTKLNDETNLEKNSTGIKRIEAREKKVFDCTTNAKTLVTDYAKLYKEANIVRTQPTATTPSSHTVQPVGSLLADLLGGTDNSLASGIKKVTNSDKTTASELAKQAKEATKAASDADTAYQRAKTRSTSADSTARDLRAKHSSDRALNETSRTAIKELATNTTGLAKSFTAEAKTQTADNEKAMKDVEEQLGLLKDNIEKVADQKELINASNELKTAIDLSAVSGAQPPIDTQADAVTNALDETLKNKTDQENRTKTINDQKITTDKLNQVENDAPDLIDKVEESLSDLSNGLDDREIEIPQSERDAQKFVPRSTAGGALANTAYCLNPARASMPNPYGLAVNQGITGVNPLIFNPNDNVAAPGAQLYYAQNNCPPGNPFAQPNGFAEFFAQNLASWQEDSILELQVVQPDVVLKSIGMKTDQSLEDNPDFTVGKESKAVIEPKKNTRLDVEKWNLTLRNNLTDPQSPTNLMTHFRTLQVSATKFEYDVDKIYKPADFQVKKPKTISINIPVNPGPFDFLFSLGKKDQDRWTDNLITPGDFDPNKAMLKLVKGYPKEVKQNFHVQFNNISPFDQVTPDVPGYNQECIAFTPPGVTGITGVEALPRIKLEWGWSNQAVAYNSCDFDNDATGIYCDAVQHSISLLKKTQVIREFLEKNGANLRCPSITNAFEGKTQEIGTDDIGIESIIPNVRGSDVNVVVTVKNQAVVNEPRSAQLTILFKNGADNSTQSCERDVNVLYKEEESCSFRAPNATNYTISAKLENISGCNTTTCDSNPNNNSISTSILIGPAAQTICPTPQQLSTMSANDIAAVYNTKNLPRFIEQSEREGIELDYENQVVPGLNKDKFIKILASDARLIQDGYSTDFQMDFDHYSQTTIFNAPEYYTIGSIGSDNMGLSRMFKDSANWKFNIGSTDGTQTLPGPGIYNTEILIGFDNPSWRFFSTDGKVSTKTNIIMRKSSTTGKGQLSDQIVPFYYLPFDGKVGTLEGDNGRTGYGLDFIGEAIKVDNQSDGLTTNSIQSSTPFSEQGVVTVTASLNFLKINQGEWADIRGQVLRVTRLPTPEISFSPSYATPLFLSLNNNAGEPCALYNLATINNSLVYTGTKSTDWWGVGANCKDFFGQSVFDDTRFPLQDISNATTGNFKTICSSQINPGTYGIEWSGPQVERGVVNLKTIFYTPQSNSNSIQLYTVSDYGRLIGQSVEGNLVPLNGVQGMRKNNPGDRINSIQDVFDLVKNKQVCVSSSPSEVKFWWNPTAIFRTTESKEKNLARTCIR